jgi:cobalt-zinc-cadmium efflux system membrane fusion protein
MKINWKLLSGVALCAAGMIGVALNSWTRGQVVGIFKQLSHGSADNDHTAPDRSWLKSISTKANTPWDRMLTLEDAQLEAIGLKVVPVKGQTEPTPLRLSGITDYDPAKVTVVRTQFDSRVDRVLVDLGTPVKRGDPLLELFSNDLAEAKSNYEAAVSQWAHDKKVLDFKAPLAKDSTLPRKELIEIENDEAQSRLKMKLAKDKLLVYGLTDKEIEHARDEDGVAKATMILRSRADGVVVLRSVVPGNYYTSADLLMTIAPLDHLWVRGNVSELDAEKVQVGHSLKVIFPFSDRTISAKVDYVDKAIDSESRSAKFRCAILNPDSRLKAGMFVRVWVELPPRPGCTVIPRSSMVTVDRSDYVFVRKPGDHHRFERRRIFVEIERNDVVVVAEPAKDHRGLSPGEEVATTGSLILEQMYEDRVMTEGGLLASRPGEDQSGAFLESPPPAFIVHGPSEDR